MSSVMTSVEDTETFLRNHPVASVAEFQSLQAHQEKQRRQRPLVADESVDVFVSNCVLNLVRPGDKARLFLEMFRVLRMGGRVAISDFVSDEQEVPVADATPFNCKGIAYRNPRQSKGLDYDATTDTSASCTTDGCC